MTTLKHVTVIVKRWIWYVLCQIHRFTMTVTSVKQPELNGCLTDVFSLLLQAGM